ncbi:MAG: hypothetical protein M5U26_13825 [Planctomycetota bacterium]|nr:hypothetical protein [Planctomycetota bacterium]
MNDTLNDGRAGAPHLKPCLNLGTLADLPPHATAPRHADKKELYAALKAAGYVGLQGADPKLCAELGLLSFGGGRINKPAEADELARKQKEAGQRCATLHVAWGIEDDAEVDALVGAILNAAAKHAFPLYIETHRATITQDLWRTVRIAKAFPDVRFNADYSHWYTGLEMPYGGVEPKADFLAPVFERVRFMHGRIGNSGCMQVDFGDGRDRPYIDHFRLLWTRTFKGFLRHAGPGDYLPFCPELLQPSINYARVFPGPDGKPVEEGDRWELAKVMTQIAKESFLEAVNSKQ